MTISSTRFGVLKSLMPALLLLIAGSVPGSAFNGHIVQEGPLTLSIDPMEDVRQFDQPQTVTARIQNAGPTGIDVELRMDGLVGEWRAVGSSSEAMTVEGGESQAATFRIAAGRGAASAMYPVHIYARFRDQGREVVAHAVQVFTSNFEQTATSTAVPPTLPVNTVPVRGALPLWPLKTYRMAWQYDAGPLVYMPVGRSGTSEESSANLSFGSVTRRATRDAIIMHPPWKPGGGTIFIEYRLALPPTRPITLKFANAIRDHGASEPPSDGVTFRVWVDDRAVFSRHTDSKRWVDGEADLSDYAGREILLRLESHPGPQHNTTCDSSYWGNPVIVSGETPAPMSPAQRQELRDAARAQVAQDHGQGAGLRLDGGYRVAIVAGDAGLFDAAIALGNENASVVFDGLRLSVLGHTIGRGPSGVNLAGEVSWTTGDRELIARQPLLFGDEQFTLTVRMWPDKAGLRIAADCPKRITDFAIGSADQKAPRVYYGHGYCIIEPEAFRAGFGGHNLSTSHVGFDFERGLSVLLATDNPPDYLEVDPDNHTYALHTHMDATMTLVPGVKGAFDCAMKYRDLYDKQPSPGFERKAGRFVFDVWGGRYAEIARKMQQMIDYRLTDSLLTVHVWQRWGYDYRLPDIYPPNPALGTIEDMKRIAAVCTEHDIPWGLHDNYIDFYPDANEYSYDHICFTEAGQPVKAWINEGRNAQSYRWRPDHIMPFVQRNLRLIGPALQPTHYFIDVFTSLECFDYYDRQGNFHSMLETRRHWGQAFAWIREYLGGNAVTTSEAGHDQLVGYLDGADCQHLQLSPDNGEFCIRLACKDWQRVPWYDAVLHDKFSLHGVGYSGRYQGGRSRAEHGIESDDYISAEILTGHAMMIDNPGFGRGAVRKYWLAQDLVRSLALDTIAGVQFVDGDIHRQIVDWVGGARVYVNRGSADWNVAGKVLPQYGYYARNGEIESSIERIGDAVVEQSQGPSKWYFNARGFGPEGQLALRPQAERVEYLGERRFKLITTWQADEPAPKDLQLFIHFVSKTSDRSDEIAFQGGGQLPQPTSQWQGSIRLGEDWTVTIPSAYGPGEYEILVGLWDPAAGARYGLLGDDDGTTRYRVGTLVVQGRGQEVRGVSLVPHEASSTNPGWNTGIKPIDFGPAATRGAFRYERDGDTLVVTPLPNLGPFLVALRLADIGLSDARVQSVVATDADGRELRPVHYEADNGRIEFETRGNEFAYVVTVGPMDTVRPLSGRRPAPLTLFDFDPAFETDQVQTSDTHVSLAAGGLQIRTGHEAPWPGVTLKAPDGKWDLSSYETLRFEVANRGDETVTVNCRVDNPGADGVNHCVTDSVTVGPQASATLTVRIFPVPWRLDTPLELVGMRAAPTHAGKLDPSNVTQVVIFVNQPKQDHTFEIGRIRTGGHIEVLDASTFLPFIDEFGQYIHKDWPGKTHSTNELIVHGQTEERDMEAHPGPKDRDQYGGWLAGPQLEATGFFRVQKHQGKWWLVDPAGRLFWSHGIDCVGTDNATPISDREAYFRDLPAKDSPFARFYGSGSWAPHGYYKDHWPYRTYDFSRANLLRKYGRNFEPLFADRTHRRFKSWGINTIANWSDESIYLMRKTPYTATIGFESKRLEGSEGYWGKFYDVFDPSFREQLRNRLAREKDRTAGDSWCIGYFVHNELSWGDDTSLAVAALSSPADQPAKKVFIEDIKTKYETIARLNDAWGTDHASWQALLQSQAAPDRQKALADLHAFYGKTARTYFETIRDELRRIAPNHLYLGCRFAWVNDIAARAAADFCDIVSYNRYTYSVEDLKLPDGMDMPLIIGEFHFGALDRGMFHTGLRSTESQQDRADKYADYVRGALRNRHIVGTHWFQYKDQATTGRGDGENYQIGFIDVCDSPYPEIVAEAREVGYSMYSYRRSTN